MNEINETSTPSIKAISNSKQKKDEVRNVSSGFGRKCISYEIAPEI